MDDPMEKFLNKKEEALNNLAILHFNLTKCEDAGFIDQGSEIYNRIDDLVEEIKMIYTFEELEELCSQGKVIESKIDMWLLSQGESTIELSWPLFKD